MSTTYTLTTPVIIGGLSSSQTVSSLQLTAINLSTTPQLAQLGTGTLALTLTDPTSGVQETISYADASVLTLWESIGDTVAQAVFAKLIADSRLPAGTLATASSSSATTTSSSTTSTASS
jgi:hypothetical protein